MIQALTYAKRAAQWFGIWLVVTFLIVGSLTSYAWAKTAISGYEWSLKLAKQIE